MGQRPSRRQRIDRATAMTVAGAVWLAASAAAVGRDGLEPDGTPSATPPTSAPAYDVTTYVRLVERSAGGDEAARASIAAWPVDALEQLRAHVGPMAPSCSMQCWRHAILLHLSLAAQVARQGDFDLWDAHMELADGALPGAVSLELREHVRDAWVRAVRLAAGYGFLERWQLLEAVDAFRRAPRDAHGLLGVAIAHELMFTLPDLARQRMDTGPGQRGPMSGLERQQLRRMERRRSLDVARKALREALALDPHLHDARLRLGRALALGGHPADARTEWQRVLEDSADPALLYMAHVFLGGLDEDGGDWKAASGHYRAAAEAVPGAQSARVRLSHALHRLGDPEGSQRELRVALVSTTRADPWLHYHCEPRRNLDALLAGLRAEKP